MDISKNYITIQGWMVQDLNLSGNELLLFALIYGFCQTENNEFNGSLSYICEWLNCTKATTISLLKKLEEKNLIIKTTNFNDKANSYTINRYIFTKKEGSKEIILGEYKNYTGGVKNLNPREYKNYTGGSIKIIPNNIYNNINNNNINNNNNKEKEIYKEKEKEKKEFDLSFIENEDFKNLLIEWLDYKKSIKDKYKCDKSIKIFYEKLLKYSNNDYSTAKEIINNSIANNYRGIFEPKQNYNSFNNNRNSIIW